MPFAAELYYFERLQGDAKHPPVVLIHGAGGSYLSWPAQVRRLPELDVYALDLPGHGKSGGHGQQSIDRYAAHVLRWLDAKKIYRAVFVGHSMGGAIALTLALQHPERVLGLGLLGTGARLRVAAPILENTSRPETIPLVLDMLREWAFAPETTPDLVEKAVQHMAATRPSVLHADFLACDAFNALDALGEIHAPALVLYGAEDRMTPVRFSQYLADQLPKARLEIVPQAGHMLMLEKPHQVAESLSSFVREIPFRLGT